MNKLVARYIGNTAWTDDQCIDNYSEQPDRAIAELYARYAGMLHSAARRFSLFSQFDVESFAFESIYKCLETFKNDGTAKFATYLTHVFRNRLLTEYRYLNAPSKHRNWYLQVQLASTLAPEDEDDYSPFLSVGYEEDFGKIEMAESIEYMTLSNVEYAYISTILESGPLVSDAQIAKEIGCSRASISQAKKKLKEKLKEFVE